MYKRIIAISFTALLLVVAVMPVSAEYPWPGEGFAGGGIGLESTGASNNTNIPGLGDVLSGDINSNLQYRGITDRGWLGAGLDTPGEACRNERQETGSLWYEIEGLTPMEPPVGALSAGRSLIGKDDGDVHLEMEIWAIVWDTQTQMGYRPNGRGSVLSIPGVLELTYTLTNVGTQPVLDLKFYQFLHPHPNGSCWNLPDGTPSHEASATFGAYDPKLYKVEDPNFPASQSFKFDLTFWAEDIHYDGEIFPGSSVGIAALEPPSVWGMGDVGTLPVPGEPAPPDFCENNPDMIWCQLEAGNLPNPKVTRSGPLSGLAGILGWEMPRLNSGHSVVRHVLFAVSNDRPPEP
ncbi:MAG: hypothetical protein JSV69_04550 [Chloroflexota bacterium]|nr:MAG: hypothetical protein JSV69_04550 [Chloroflexota bacterium]